MHIMLLYNKTTYNDCVPALLKLDACILFPRVLESRSIIFIKSRRWQQCIHSFAAQVDKVVRELTSSGPEGAFVVRESEEGKFFSLVVKVCLDFLCGCNRQVSEQYHVFPLIGSNHHLPAIFSFLLHICTDKRQNDDVPYI